MYEVILRHTVISVCALRQDRIFRVICLLKVTKAGKGRLYRKPLYGNGLGMFIQMTNLKHAAAHLENSKFINIRMRLRTNECSYIHCELGRDFSREVLLCVQI